MKLFQQMLVAGASVSLLAPIAAQASDVVNLEEMNSYSRSTKRKSSRFDILFIGVTRTKSASGREK